MDYNYEAKNGKVSVDSNLFFFEGHFDFLQSAGAMPGTENIGVLEQSENYPRSDCLPSNNERLGRFLDSRPRSSRR